MIKLFSILAVVGFVFLGVIVGLLNPTSVAINIFVTDITLPLSVVMSALFVMGMAVGALIIYFKVLRLHLRLQLKIRENHKLTNQVVEMKKELVNFKEQKVKVMDHESSSIGLTELSSNVIGNASKSSIKKLKNA